ncbi:ABC transporter transmembrane domain-containing protein [Aliivibrio kagoshimensis]|uniref:ABC transporter transmembrane domain-containing protein n=1 Tax=Aliivibrio kagoshimensis TaxID=2910230 RepID=UPI003D147A45
MRIFAQLFWYFKRQWRKYLGAILILTVVSLLEVIPPKLIGQVVDQVVDGTMHQSELWLPLLGIGGIWLFSYFLRVLWRVWLFGAAAELGTVLRNRLFKHFSKHPPRFFERYKTGDLMARSTNDVNAVVMTAGEGVLTAADSLISGAIVLIVMTTQLSWELTLLALLPMPIMALFVNKLGSQLHGRFSSSQAAFSSLTETTQDSLNGIRMVRSFGLEQHQQANFDAAADQAGEHNMAVAEVDAKFDPVIYSTIGMSFFLSVAGGGYMVSQGALTLGDLTAFTLYQGLMIWPMLAIAWLFNIIERGSAAWKRLQTIFDEEPEIVSGSSELTQNSTTLHVDVKNFSWHSQQHPVLHQIAFGLQPGSILGLAGPVGSGKSSVIALLLRLQELKEGEIHLGDVEIKHADLSMWRSTFAVVSQAPFLFSRSIADNIALGFPNATREQIRHAAQLACIDEDIMTFKQGYETLVGEKGITLSGGQKQRISIARALLLDAPILILDDALSAVDGRTEHQILSNLHRSERKQSVIVIAHRLTALEQADQIIVLNQGHVTEQGTHQQLINQNSWYSEMHQYQMLVSELEA